jgi:predicted O-linked N-acetylglucosamine transferase (SPINDLY family)
MREADKREIAEGMRERRTLISLLHHRAISDSEAQYLMLTQLRASTIRRPKAPLWRGERYRHDKIRIAYLSTDLRDHVVADAIVGCFEQHDRTQFDTTAISLGPDDGSATRRRIEAAFDRFIDVRARSDAEVSALVRDLEIDIAIDLSGYSGDARTEILAPRPAPVQVNYFGYSGTMAVPFIDYIIADPWLIPADHQPYYTKQVVYLPYTYLPSDRKRPVASDAPTRAEAGLPDTGFVFASAARRTPRSAAKHAISVLERRRDLGRRARRRGSSMSGGVNIGDDAFKSFEVRCRNQWTVRPSRAVSRCRIFLKSDILACLPPRS